MRLVNIAISIVLLFLANASIAQDEFQVEEAFRLYHEDGSEFEDLIVFDFGDDGIHEIICEIADSVRQYIFPELGVYHADGWVFESENLNFPIDNLIITDFNRDQEPDIMFGIDNREEGDPHNGIYVFFGPDFSELLFREIYYFKRFLFQGGDRILEDGSTNPFVFIGDSATFDWDYNWRERHYHEKYTKATFWEGTWGTDDRPRHQRRAVSLPISYEMARTENGSRNDFFLAGWNHYNLDVQNAESEWHRDEYYFQLCTSYQRPFGLPDSMMFLMIDDLPENADVFHLFNFSKDAIVMDLDQDERLEWVQPYWERDPENNTFTVHVAVFYPDSLVFDREYTEELEGIYYDEEIPPNPIRGIVQVDIDSDGIYELLLACQGQPLKVIGSQTMDLISVSDIELPDEIDDILEIGHFDNPERLQIILRNGDGEIVIYNLPEYWRAPFLDVKPIVPQVPLMFALFEPYPNPFNSTTTIQYSIPKLGQTRLSVYNISGREVAVLVDQQMEAGYHQINWNATNLPSGLYFAQLQNGGRLTNKRLVLIK